MRMHADQVDVTVADARRLLPAELADLPVRPVPIPRPYAQDAERGWTIQQWLPGGTPSSDGRGGRALADDLVGVLEALWRVPTAGGVAPPRTLWPAP